MIGFLLSEFPMRLLTIYTHSDWNFNCYSVEKFMNGFTCETTVGNHKNHRNHDCDLLVCKLDAAPKHQHRNDLLVHITFYD